MEEINVVPQRIIEWAERQQRRIEHKLDLRLNVCQYTASNYGRKAEGKLDDVLLQILYREKYNNTAVEFGDGYKEISLTEIKKKYKLSGTKDIAKFFLFDCGFFNYAFGWARYYKISGLRTTLENKFMLVVILEWIIETEILRDENKTEEEEEQVYPEGSGVYVNDNRMSLKLLVGNILKRIDAMWEEKDKEIKLSDKEYYILSSILFDGNFVGGYEGSEIDNDTYSYIDKADWHQIMVSIKKKCTWLRHSAINLDKQYNREIEDLSSDKEKLQISVPTYLRYVISGLFSSYDTLPMVVRTSLSGGKLPDTNSRDERINQKWKERLFLSQKSANIPDEVMRCFADIFRYIEYSFEMDMRREDEMVLERYLYSMCKMAYFVSYEGKAFKGSAIDAWENMFGLYLNKIETEKLAARLKGVGDWDGINEFYKNGLQRILRKVFLIKSPLLKVYVVQKMFDSILNDFVGLLSKSPDVYSMAAKGKIDGWVAKWETRIDDVERYYYAGEYIIGKEQVKALLGGKNGLCASNNGKEPRGCELIAEYEGFYAALIDQARTFVESKNDAEKGFIDSFSRKKCEKFASKFLSDVVNPRKDIALWVVKCNLGIYENKKIEVVEV